MKKIKKQLCFVNGCNRIAEAKGTCVMHYNRYRRTGNYDNELKKDINFEIDKNGCFICTSHKVNKNGYFTLVRNNKKEYIHRIVYKECFGDIPKGFVVRHKCDVRSCINPEHLEIGTQLDNMRDMKERKRSTYGERSSTSLLKEKDVIEIIYMLKTGSLTQKEIAKRFNVNRTTINDINCGRTWRYLTCPTKAAKNV